MKYIKRWLEPIIEESLSSNPVIVLTGPRQVGKSTLLKESSFTKKWKYITLDNIDVLDQAKEDPKGLLSEDVPTIIDEIQRCPDLLITVKYLVDETNRRRKFILSGSANILLRTSPRETLAGRVKYLYLDGLSFRETQGVSSLGVLDNVWNDTEVKCKNVQNVRNISELIWRGGLPGVILSKSTKIALDRGLNYVDTYINRDI